MSKLYTIKSSTTFYPLPPIHQISGGTVYAPLHMFKDYVLHYSKVIDAEYQKHKLEGEHEIHEGIAEVWGDDWGRLAHLIDPALASVIFWMNLVDNNPDNLIFHIDSQRPLFERVRTSPVIIPCHEIILDTNSKFADFPLLVKLLDQEYFAWNRKKILLESFEQLVRGGRVHFLGDGPKGPFIDNGFISLCPEKYRNRNRNGAPDPPATPCRLPAKRRSY